MNLHTDFHVRSRKKAQFDEFDSREVQVTGRRHSMAWVAVGTTVAGIGTSLYSANKMSKDMKGANNANLTQQELDRQENERRYMLSRGVTSDGGVVNTRLPLWASIARPNGAIVPANSAPPRLVASIPSGLYAPKPGATTVNRSFSGLGITR